MFTAAVLKCCINDVTLSPFHSAISRNYSPCLEQIEFNQRLQSHKHEAYTLFKATDSFLMSLLTAQTQSILLNLYWNYLQN